MADFIVRGFEIFRAEMLKRSRARFRPLRNVRRQDPRPLYEAALLAVEVIRERDCAPGPAAHLTVEMKIPGVTHTVVARKFEEWPNGGAKSPKEAIEKRRLRELLDA